jgi:hypothetical protein
MFSTTFGVFIGFYFFGLLFASFIALLLVCYVYLLVLPRNIAPIMITVTSAVSTMSCSYYVYHMASMESGGLIDLVFMVNVVKLHMFAINYRNAGKLDDPVAGKYLSERERYFAEILRGKPVSFYDWC